MKGSWRRVAAAAITIAACCNRLQAQDEHMLALTGATGTEELDETIIERFEALERHRVHINTASLSRLTSCGLFTPFQVASIVDWRRNSGDILSVTELGSIDGFNPLQASHMAPYLDFSSKVGIGRSSSRDRHRHDISGRFQARKDGKEDAAASWGIKYRYICEERGSISLAARNGYDSGGLSPDTWSFSAALEGRRHLDRLIIGDFNAHFGQGLALWSGFSLSGAGTVEAFCKRAGGISPTWSYSSTNYRGAAAAISLGSWTISGMTAFPGLRAAMDKGHGDISVLPAANISWLGRSGQFSLTGYAHRSDDAKIAADVRWHQGSFDFYGETALDAVTGALGGIAGTIWSPKWHHRYAAMVRAYPNTYTPGQSGAIRAGSKVTDETGVTVGMQLPWISLTADAAMFPSRGAGQLKIVGKSVLQLSEHLSLIPYASCKITDGSRRTDMRADCKWSLGPWNASIRSNWLRCQAWAWLQYAECGYMTDRISSWLRATVFQIDNWDDRIYVYERDAPGNFNVPAYYGHGVAGSAVVGWKWGRQRLHLRASMIHYASDKPSRVEFRCQYSVQL